jgi:putative (di)nucleoside polyphosphate hydrolase
MNPALYRPCVGIALVNARHQVFVGQRIDNMAEAWQMPQGGIDAGETSLEAAYREVQEEIGLRPDDVEHLASLDDWLFYDLPPDLQPLFWGGAFKGQRQQWFLFRLLSGEEAINLNAHHPPEFKAWRWLAVTELENVIVPFKRSLYRQVATWLERVLP